MNTSKFKSVAISVEIYKQLQKMAAAGDRSMSRQIAHMVKTYDKNKAA
tara:strand:+ start:158 stop:301 length:144 start_codon:yes stop_codon:yes gene_type:complete